MIPSFYNFSVSPTWAEIQAVQAAQAAQAEEIPKAEIRDWFKLGTHGGKPYIKRVAYFGTP